MEQLVDDLAVAAAGAFVLEDDLSDGHLDRELSSDSQVGATHILPLCDLE